MEDNHSGKEKKTTTTLDSIPLESSRSEYEALSSQVRDLSEEEALEELLDCARYGESDPVRAVVVEYPWLTHKARGEDGSTALHMACANGHDVVAKLLLLHQPTPLLPNTFGNTPLHWAAANGHERTVRVLLQHGQDVDVLIKNQAGRSALTEGFASSNTQVAKMLLEHDSATEERLLQGTTKTTTNEEKDKATKNRDFVQHEFVLGNKNNNKQDKDETVLRIRELPIDHADNPFGEEGRPQDDTTGYGIWSASLVLAQWLVSSSSSSVMDWQDKRVLELGAGCGLPGLAVALHHRVQSVIVTDLNPQTVENLQHNVQLNQDAFKSTKDVTASVMDWCDASTWPYRQDNDNNGDGMVDVVVGSDLVYQKGLVPLLLRVLTRVLKADGGIFWYAAPDTDRDGLKEFLHALLEKGGFVLERQEVAPLEYKANAFRNQDDELFFLHFPEMASTTYILYQFVRKATTTTQTSH